MSVVETQSAADARYFFASHWPEYLSEALGLGAFMVSACVITVMLEHPASALRIALADPLARRALIGLAMGLTAVAIIYSPWGQRSGAHLNPSVTLTFLRLGKIRGWDAAFYVASQVIGGLSGVLLTWAVLGAALAAPAVHYAVTVPGAWGALPAFLGELMISFGLMLAVLGVSNTPRLARFTGLAAGALVAVYITFEAPLSGMSMNPARTLGSAIPAGDFTGLWLYLTAPPLGMLLAAETYVHLRGAAAVVCAKLHHPHDQRCIFACGYRSR
jgi:aquaporin Z